MASSGDRYVGLHKSLYTSTTPLLLLLPLLLLVLLLLLLLLLVLLLLLLLVVLIVLLPLSLLLLVPLLLLLLRIMYGTTVNAGDEEGVNSKRRQTSTEREARAYTYYIHGGAGNDRT